MINSVSSMEELQKVFSDEYKKFDKNSPEMRVLVDAKDAKKVSLTPAFNPAVLNNNHEIKKQPEEVKVAAAKIDDF
jgi:hypothetical protein